MAFDFPASPAEGQVFNAPGGPSYVFNSPLWRAVGQGQIAIISDAAPSNPANGTLWLESDTGLLFAYWNDGNSSQWVQVGGNASSGAIVTTVITTSGTYTAPVGLRYLEVTGWGGGGAGGGSVVTAATTVSGGAGGNAGAKASVLLTAAQIGASQAMVIGAGGTGVSGATGNAGQDTTFGSFLSAKGGEGAAAVTAAVTIAFNPPSATQSATGDFRGWTIRGSTGTHNSGNAFAVTISGQNEWGGGVITVVAGNGGSANANTGAGGGGTTNSINQATPRTGGTGGSGVIILKEYF